MLDDKVRMKVVPQISGPKYARRGQRAIEGDTLLYCIRYETGGFFTYSYCREEDAKEVIRKMQHEGTDTVRYRDFNIVDSVDETLHVVSLD